MIPRRRDVVQSPEKRSEAVGGIGHCVIRMCERFANRVHDLTELRRRCVILPIRLMCSTLRERVVERGPLQRPIETRGGGIWLHTQTCLDSGKTSTRPQKLLWQLEQRGDLGANGAPRARHQMLGRG